MPPRSVAAHSVDKTMDGFYIPPYWSGFTIKNLLTFLKYLKIQQPGIEVVFSAELYRPESFNEALSGKLFEICDAIYGKLSVVADWLSRLLPKPKHRP